MSREERRALDRVAPRPLPGPRELFEPVRFSWRWHRVANTARGRLLRLEVFASGSGELIETRSFESEVRAWELEEQLLA
ncbi:MAG: hypothetical protein V3S03_08535 [Vicinamibacteria bacterium]